MTPKGYMITGTTLGLIFTSVALIFDIGTLGVATFAAGALFGKGYGVWETRQRLHN